MKEIYKKLKDPKFATYIFASGEGKNRAKDAAHDITTKLRKGNHNVSDNKYILLQIASGETEITIDEIGEINDILQGINNHMTIIMSVLEKDIKDDIELRVIFTDIEIGENTDIDFVFNSKPKKTKSIPIYFLEEEYSTTEISEIISFLSDVYKDIGGDKLKIRGFQSIEVESLEPVLY